MQLDLFCSVPEILHVRVTPKAKLERIKPVVSEEGPVFYRVYVTVAAEKGKANKAVISVLAKYFGVPKSSLLIISGALARDKVIRIKKG